MRNPTPSVQCSLEILISKRYLTMTVGLPLQGLTGTPGVQGAEGKPGPLVSSMGPS